MSKIIYVGPFSTENNKRSASPAGQTMTEYVCQSINNAGYEVTIFSFLPSLDGQPCERAQEIINSKTTAIFMPCFKVYGNNVLMRLITKIKRKKALEKELDALIENGDTVIAYHSLVIIDALKKLRKKKKFKFILQVCEIYADVLEDKSLRKKEIEFINTADKYILISELLAAELGLNDKEGIVCSGTYKAEKLINEPPQDGKLHIVYAGTLDVTKGGAYFAVSAAKYLNENYHMHILGFGNEHQKNQLIELIEKTKEETTCFITYDGCLQGEDYIRFLQGCHIGLSTQNPNGSYNATSFPSKILVYLANGLRVVSIKIPVIEASNVNKAIVYYTENNPQQIAQAIAKAEYGFFDGKNLIEEMNCQFVSNLSNILDEK